MQTQAKIATRQPLGTQLTRFLVIGATTVSFDFGFLFLLVHILRWNYFVSAFLAFASASTLNYGLSAQYVFLGGRFRRSTEFTIFMVTTAVGLGLNQFTMWALVSGAGVNYMLAKCASVTIVTVWNFLSKKKIVFLD